ncbi:MAG TPA: hypothetical protein VFL91_15515, partial [Thermomicrobiales bacterium]|nr:hypothetical protein [Thermomicrobiales bacterium]
MRYHAAVGTGDRADGRTRPRTPTPRPSAPARWWRRYTTLRVRGGPGLETNRRLAKWALISPFIGLVAGLGAIALYSGIQAATAWFLGRGAGYLPPLPAGEGPTVVRPAPHPWLIVAMVALGGLISGLLVFVLAPEAEGHGTDAAIG